MALATLLVRAAAGGWHRIVSNALTTPHRIGSKQPSVRCIRTAFAIGSRNNPGRRGFQLRRSQGHAKHLSALNGWLAEWFKAPVLETTKMYVNRDDVLLHRQRKSGKAISIELCHCDRDRPLLRFSQQAEAATDCVRAKA
jgi:hypothetical protein